MSETKPSSWGTADQVETPTPSKSNLWMIRRLYNRPTTDQAIVEVMKDFIANYEEDPEHSATLEPLVEIARQQLAKERRDREST